MHEEKDGRKKASERARTSEKERTSERERERDSALMSVNHYIRGENAPSLRPGGTPQLKPEGTTI